MTINSCFLLLALAGAASAHLCLLRPRQRSDMDISEHGSKTCFRREPPCGGPSIEQPSQVLIAGKTEVIKFQQNFNHYSIGFPGYLDVSYGNVTDGKDPEKYIPLAAIGDGHPFAQDNQRNYTVTVVLPNLKCDHCIIRTRYIAHKPGETPFYQCADIKIKLPYDDEETSPAYVLSQAQHLPPAAGKAMVFIQGKQREGHAVNKRQAPTRQLVGVAYNPVKPTSSRYQTVDMLTGGISVLGDSLPGMDTDHPFPPDADGNIVGAYTSDQVFVTDRVLDITVMIVHEHMSLDDFPKTVIVTGSRNGSVMSVTAMDTAPTAPISGLAFAGAGKYIGFSLNGDPSNPGKFYFELYQLDHMGGVKNTFISSDTEDLYVNYQWMTYDTNNKKLYVLMGNENAAFKLNARIYTYDFSGQDIRSLGYIELDVSKFTVQSIHIHEYSGKLYSMSPGLWGQDYPSWSLVAIDPVAGVIIEVKEVAPSGIFGNFYSGAIANAVDAEANTFTYILRTPDSASDVITVVSLQYGQDTFSQMTNLRHLHNFALV